MSNCKDVKGNTLEVGHWVTIVPRMDLLWIGKVVEVDDGGMSLVVSKGNQALTPAKVRIILDVTLNANPQMPLFTPLVRIVMPESEKIVEKLLADSEKKNPPDGGSIVM
jgi:hypothetical protein